jgi:hypothetical protein
MNDFIGLLFHSRTQVHIFHLQTTSYAKHIALQGYYEGIVPLIDALVEAYQGKYGLLTDYRVNFTTKDLSSDDEATNYFNALAKVVERKREGLPQDAFLQNIYDDIETLIHSTNYKLRFLS